MMAGFMPPLASPSFLLATSSVQEHASHTIRLTRVDPVRTSGPVIASMARSTLREMRGPGLQETATVLLPQLRT